MRIGDRDGQIKRLAAAGLTQRAIAEATGVSQSSVSRVLREEAAPAPPGPLATAVDEHLDGLELAGEQRLRAIALRGLAATVDRASSSTSVSAGAALPGLVREFLAELDALVPGEDVPTQVERLLRPLGRPA